MRQSITRSRRRPARGNDKGRLLSLSEHLRIALELPLYCRQRPRRASGGVYGDVQSRQCGIVGVVVFWPAPPSAFPPARFLIHGTGTRLQAELHFDEELLKVLNSDHISEARALRALLPRTENHRRRLGHRLSREVVRDYWSYRKLPRPYSWPPDGLKRQPRRADL
jgi:hypothetical protein